MAGDGLCVVGLVEIEVVRGIGIVFLLGLLRVVIGHGGQRGGGGMGEGGGRSVEWCGFRLGNCSCTFKKRSGFI